MTHRTRHIIEELVVWSILCGLAFGGLQAWRWLSTPPAIDHDAGAPEPVVQDDGCRVVSAPDQFVPQHVRCADGSESWFGDASFYDYTFEPGSDWGRVCNRIREDCWTEDRFVAASRDFPRGSKLFVTNMANGRGVVVAVTDFGPDGDLHPERVIDLSSRAFAQIADLGDGIVPVKVELLLP